MSQVKAWNVILQGEDHTEFCVEYRTETKAQAREEAEEDYPEATVMEVFDPIEREEEIYRRANDIYDNPDLDDYDY